MPNIKLDIYGGHLRRGHFDNKYDHARRRAKVTLLTNSPTANLGEDALIEAIDTAVNHPAVGDYHQSSGQFGMVDLPLQHTSAERTGPTEAWLDLTYFRTSISVSSNSLLRSRTRGGYTAIEWYSRPTTFNNGLPAGQPVFSNGGTLNTQYIKPRVWLWVRPLIEVSIPFSLSFDPGGNCAPLLGKVNNNPLVFANPPVLNGLVIPQGWLRFDSYDVDAIESGNNVTYYGHYNFSYSYGGWYTQRAEYITGNWQFLTEIVYPQASFTSGTPFP